MFQNRVFHPLRTTPCRSIQKLPQETIEKPQKQFENHKLDLGNLRNSFNLLRRSWRNTQPGYEPTESNRETTESSWKTTRTRWKTTRNSEKHKTYRKKQSRVRQNTSAILFIITSIFALNLSRIWTPLEEIPEGEWTKKCSKNSCWKFFRPSKTQNGSCKPIFATHHDLATER